MIRVTTDHPLAAGSVDHLWPKGTATDSSTRPGFNKRLYDLIPAQQVRLLDLGCAGGGLVRSVLDDGGLAVGIDGSDFSRKTGRAEWPVIPGNLFTADITHPFQVWNNGGIPQVFDVVTAWEVLEHIAEPDLPALLGNVARHLAPRGMFICSISQMADHWEGHDYHVTVHPRSWWLDYLARQGWRVRGDLFAHFDPEWVRGPENGMASFPLVVDLP